MHAPRKNKKRRISVGALIMNGISRRYLLTLNRILKSIGLVSAPKRRLENFGSDATADRTRRMLYGPTPERMSGDSRRTASAVVLAET